MQTTIITITSIAAVLLTGCATCPDSTSVISSNVVSIPNVPVNAPRTGTMAWCRMDPDKIQSCTMNNKGNWECQPFRGHGPVTEVPGPRVK